MPFSTARAAVILTLFLSGVAAADLWWDADWQYESWDWYAGGEGIGQTGYELYNWHGGIREYEDSYTSISGSFRIESDRYWDTDLDGNWYDNYYTEYFTSYDAEYGWEETSYYFRDRLTIWQEYDYYLEQNRFSGEMYSYENHRIDTDDDDNLYDYGDSGAYYSSVWSDFRAYDQFSSSASTLYDPFSHYYTSTYADSHALTGHMYSEYTLVVDTDGDGMYEGGWNPDDYYYYESSYYDSWDGHSGSETTLWDVPAHYYMATSNFSTATGSWNEDFEYAVDTDGDGDIEAGSNGDDYYTYADSGFDASSLDSWSNSELWDIPNGYYYATEDYSNASSGHFSNESWAASDTDDDGHIENWFMSDDSYQYVSSGYNPTTDLTYSYFQLSIDGHNNEDQYAWMTEDHWSRGSGDFGNEYEGANLVGWYLNWDGYDIGDEYEYQGPRTYQRTQTKVWGEGGYYVATNTRTADAGNHSTWTQVNQDTDGDTAWDNTDDYEIFSRDWDVYEDSWHNVGYYVDNNDTDLYVRFEQSLSPSVDTLSYEYEDGATGMDAGVFLIYDSGSTTPFDGYAYVYNAEDYEFIWFDGEFMMLPYPIGIGNYY